MNNPADTPTTEAVPPVVAIIPFVSRQVSRNWRVSCQLLQETIASILALPEDFIDVTVVGHDQPEFLATLKRVRWVTVDYPPPDIENNEAKHGDSGFKRMFGVRDAFARRRQWVLFMDADDLVSSRLHRVVDLEHHDAVVFDAGYFWVTGRSWLQRMPKFHKACGSSLLIRLSRENFPCWLGGTEKRLGDANHNDVADAFAAAAARVQILREPMAIYRGAPGNEHLSAGQNSNWKMPKGSFVGSLRYIARMCLRSRPLTGRLAREFSIKTSGI
jgi:hypothetical protein